ncbi:MAG: von Willebrand factor type A domain protein [Candidatus Dependentiae bacterium ADurb.Bin331]|nr:MAG: von Willebrand factor type A domain protein [Candidatus Dependentiae bacterium ADurb.Bin331]
MNYSFRFAYPWILIIGIILIIVAVLLRRSGYRPTAYRYSLINALKKSGASSAFLPPLVLNILRTGVLVMLVLLAARPQLVDIQSKVPVHGIDIMLALDASASMQCFDDVQDQRSRFDVAKTEAIKFIERQENNQVGLVVFGRDAVSRCPLTLDKKILTDLIKQLELGAVNPQGTVLGVAIAMAARRLQQSKAKTKIMIVLTDGEPTPELDLDPQKAVELAKKFGIKIYTIGIGDEHGGLFRDPLFGIRAMGFKLNTQLLRSIAHQTGGRYFEARKPHELQHIYATIDLLEKSEHEATIFSTYYELLFPFCIAAASAIMLELLASLLWVII